MSFFLLASLIFNFSLKGIKRDIHAMELFLDNAQNVKPNFEESLQLYTEGTQEAIDYVATLRPDNESEYIQFISSVEDLGEALSLNVDLESMDTPKATNLGATLRYRVKFFGGQNDLLSFLSGLESLPYYIRVDDVQFENLALMKNPGADMPPNVVLTLDLYVK